MAKEISRVGLGQENSPETPNASGTCLIKPFNHSLMYSRGNIKIQNNLPQIVFHPKFENFHQNH